MGGFLLYEIASNGSAFKSYIGWACTGDDNLRSKPLSPTESARRRMHQIDCEKAYEGDDVARTELKPRRTGGWRQDLGREVHRMTAPT